MTDLAKIGLATVAFSVLSWGFYLYGERTGVSYGSRRYTGQRELRRAAHPELFAEHQARLRTFAQWSLAPGVVCVLAAVWRHQRQSSS